MLLPEIRIDDRNRVDSSRATKRRVCDQLSISGCPSVRNEPREASVRRAKTWTVRECSAVLGYDAGDAPEDGVERRSCTVWTVAHRHYRRAGAYGATCTNVQIRS